MKRFWILAAFFSSLHGCGMIGATRQVVVPPSSLDNYRSPAWVIHNPPLGAPIPTEDSDD